MHAQLAWEQVACSAEQGSRCFWCRTAGEGCGPGGPCSMSCMRSRGGVLGSHEIMGRKTGAAPIMIAGVDSR